MGTGTSTPAAVAESLAKPQASYKVSAEPQAQRSLEAVARDYFSDTPIMAEIARCETRFRHYERNGEVLRGKIDGNDVGIMQVNERYHLKRAQSLGFDIYSLEGNLAYAKYLYHEEGSDPWLSSSACWGGYREKAPTVTVKTSAFAKLSVPRVEQN